MFHIRNNTVMRFFLDKISKLRIGWNERPLTEADFYRLCKQFNVRVTETPLATGGFYYRLMGRDFIAIDSKLSGARKLAVLFHELAHFLFHVPESGPTANFYNVGRRTRKEIEADIFSLCALIPFRSLASRSLQELVEENGFPLEMAIERYEIFRRYGI